MSSNILEAFFKEAAAALTAIPAVERPEIYAISFLVYDDQDDPRRPTLTIGTNTFSQWQESIDQASGTAEAKWNYAFWRQDQLAVLGEANTVSAMSISDWIKSLGLYYTDEEKGADFEKCSAIGEQITRRFIEIACETAKALHAERVVEAIFNAPVPILIHELEYYDEIANQTDIANPRGLASEFIDWVRTGQS